jgi:type IV pilus assembly protein PilY1
MTRLKYKPFIRFLIMMLILGQVILPVQAAADDTCVFGAGDSSSSLTPNIAILLDNGVEMTHAAPHTNFDNTKDWSPVKVAEYRVEVVPNGGCASAGVTISALSTSTGYETGGTSVTITGTGFLTGAKVLFGTKEATDVVVVSATQITCKTPAGTGTVNVTVTNTDATTGTKAAGFTYEAEPSAAPDVVSISPENGPTAGGTTVTITGTGFQSGAKVYFGTNEATNVVVVSATQITCKTPAGSGTVNVKVENPDSQSDTLVNIFTYSTVTPNPTVTKVTPDNGLTTEEKTVTITGTYFQSGAAVTFGGTLATNVVVVNDTTITCKTPAGTAGKVDVVVTNPDGKAGTLKDGYEYTETALPPEITSYTPSVGPASGGTEVIITGKNFNNATVYFGTKEATIISQTATEIKCITPSGTAGPVDLEVKNANGDKDVEVNAFTYQALAPTVSNVNPATGPEAGGTAVTITGTNFQSGATVKFNNILATNVVVVNATTITCKTPAGTGAVKVKVVNPDTQSAEWSGTFTYTAPGPTVTQYTIVAADSNAIKFEVNETVTGTPSGTTAKLISKTAGPGSKEYTYVVEVTGTANFGGLTDTTLTESSSSKTTTIKSITVKSPAPAAMMAASESAAPAKPVYAKPPGDDGGGGGGGGGGGTTTCGNGFYNKYGYEMDPKKGDLCMVGVDMAATSTCLDGDSGGNITIKVNGVARTIKLPMEGSSAGDAEYNLDDFKGPLRYSANYLNWLFYSGEYTGNGSDLSNKSRFWWAKYAMLSVGYLTNNQVNYSIWNYVSNLNGASGVQPWKQDWVADEDADTLEGAMNPAIWNNFSNMGVVTAAPLAEGLASMGHEFSTTGKLSDTAECAGNYIILVTPGISSEDLGITTKALPDVQTSDYDGDGTDSDDYTAPGTVSVDGADYTIPTNYNGSSYTDDVASYLYKNKIIPKANNVITYTVSFMADANSKKYLINTSNNGNGREGLTNSSDPDYGKWHYDADKPEELSTRLWEAISSILNRTNTFTAPVVPVTRTTSGNTIYMAFFKPDSTNFWEGNLTKFGLDSSLQITDKNGDAATWPNGAMKETAAPYWQTKDWATPGSSNYIHNADRKIYSYFSGSGILSDSNAFTTGSTAVTSAVGTITTAGGTTYSASDIIKYVRGADATDEDRDGDKSENREVITGDILHSEPAVVRYIESGSEDIRVYYSANDGMVHQVKDADGSEAWAFIPPDQLGRLKLMLGDDGHQYYVDSSPRVWISEDVAYNHQVDEGEEAILVFGERKGGRFYYGLDISDPDDPKLLWSREMDGESWGEPEFGKVKAGGTTLDAVFVGGGYAEGSTTIGNSLVILDMRTGDVIKEIDNGDGAANPCSFPSGAFPVDINGDDLIDKVYMGDICGQMWRYGYFIDDNTGKPFVFPGRDQDVGKWTGKVIIDAASKFFYPPTVTLEKGYDIVFAGTGDREDPCNESTQDQILVIKDTHDVSVDAPYPLTDASDKLVDNSTPVDPPINMDDANVYGWYINLAAGEKVLATGIVFYKVYYITTFTPDSSDPCVPGGTARVYGLYYRTGLAVSQLGFSSDDGRSQEIGGGIPSKPVIVITDEETKVIFSVGSTLQDDEGGGGGGSTDAGIFTMDPLESKNFFELWWKYREGKWSWE